MLDKKQLLIIDKLIQNPVLTKDELTKKFSLSDRQIEYSIDKLNQYLDEKGKKEIDADGVYITVPSETYDYLLNIRVSENLMSLKRYVLSNDERKLFLTLLLSTSNKYLSLVHLQELLRVSQSTVSKDLKQLELDLFTQQLKISYDRKTGYKINGREDAIRMCLIKNISNELVENRSELLNNFIDSNCRYGLNEIFELVSNLKDHYQIKFVENRLREFCYILTIIIDRLYIKPNYVPANVKKFNIRETNEYRFSEELLDSLGIENKNAAEYVATIVLCLSIGGEKNFDIDNYIYSITEKIVDKFSDISGIDFTDNKKVIGQIFTHFRSMYFRLQFKFPITNPLTKQVMKEYNEIFELLSQTISKFEDELGKVPNEEIAYLTIHLIGFIYDSNQNKRNYLSAAIVCPNGIGSSALAYLQLTNIFPNIKFMMPFPYSELKSHLDEIDMIFSTFYRSDLFTLGKPCFVINPILTDDDKYAIVQKVNSSFSSNNFVAPTLDTVMKVINNNVRNTDMLKKIRKDLSEDIFRSKPIFNVHKLSIKDVIKPDYIQLHTSYRDYQDAVEASLVPFLKNNIIRRSYISKILNQINNGIDFVIAPNIALPHTNPHFGANKIGIGILSIKEPIVLSENKRVKYIFSLSAINSTDHLNALNDLMNLISDEKFMKILDDEKCSSLDVINYIYKY